MIYVREYSWMWEKLGLSLAECRVYAYIYGLTHGEKGGYDGSKRHLAESLGLSDSTVRDALDKLKDQGLISWNNMWFCTSASDDNSTARSPREDERSPREIERSPRSPHTPLYNNIIDKKQADMQTDFDLFFKKFAPEFRNRYAVTQYNFFQRSEPAQQAMYDAVKEEQDGSVNKNPFFFVQDFPEPQPKWLVGNETGEDIVQVKYGDRFKLCSRETMNLFKLEWVRDW